MKKARGTDANRAMAEFGEKILFQPMMKYNKGNTLDVRWRYGLFTGLATRTNMDIVGGAVGHEDKQGHFDERMQKQ